RDLERRGNTARGRIAGYRRYLRSLRGAALQDTQSEWPGFLLAGSAGRCGRNEGSGGRSAAVRDIQKGNRAGRRSKFRLPAKERGGVFLGWACAGGAAFGAGSRKQHA